MGLSFARPERCLCANRDIEANFTSATIGPSPVVSFKENTAVPIMNVYDPRIFGILMELRHHRQQVLWPLLLFSAAKTRDRASHGKDVVFLDAEVTTSYFGV